MELSLTAVPTDTCGIDKCYGCGSFARQCLSGELVPGRLGEHAEVEPPRPIPPPPPPPPRHRYRARYTKTGRMRFLSHLELSRTVMRAFRRAAVPLAHTEGFHPMPRLAFASALAVGVESRGDFLDFESTERRDPAALLSALNAGLPEGLRVAEIAPVDPDAPSLGEVVNAARYTVRLADPPPGEALQARLAEVLSDGAELRVVRERKGQTEEVDVRPSLHRLSADPGGAIEMVLRVGGSGTARPDDVIRGLFGPQSVPPRIVREELLALQDGCPRDPMSLCRADRPAAEPVPVAP
jgi:radical SAM-linked protein